MAIVTKTCSIENCDKSVVARGWCRMHYNRWYTNGSPLCLRPVGKHHESYSTEYKSWISMKTRCYNPSTIRFELYGGRGIAVCERWINDFPAFLLDMGRKPSPAHSLDRIDPNGNYEPSNCRWATPLQQTLNRRTLGGSSKFKGVSWCKRDNKWLVCIAVSSKTINCGRYNNELEAAWMYDQFAIALYGDEAKTNFRYE